MATIARHLAGTYDLHNAHIDRFSPDHPTYLATIPTLRRVVRIGRSQQHHAASLRALEAATYPAPRVIPANNGAFVTRLPVEDDAHEVIVLSFIEGTTPDRNCAPDLHALGSALGHLHHRGSSITAAAGHPDTTLPVIKQAAMLPANELRFGLRQLALAEHQLASRETAAQQQKLVDACTAGLRPVAGLTQTFLHGDAHPWNSVIDPAGRAHYIDWDSAGPGPAIVDLAFLVVSCATGGLMYPYAPTNPAAVDSLLDGYRNEMSLSQPDLDALDHAVAFRILVCVAVGYSHYGTCQPC